MHLLKSAKPLIIYLIIVLLLATLLNLFIRSYSSANYTDQKKEDLLSAPSQFRSLNNDPCANSIYGDPGGVADNYIKINLHCSKDSGSTNTLDLKSISPDTYLGALYLLANINAFEAGIIPERVDKLGSLKAENNEWRCFTGIESEVRDFNQKLKSPTTLNCFYNFPDEEVKNYYETH